MKRFKSITVAAAISMACASAPADTLEVPSAKYPTIQSAINATVDGDEVAVAPGTYNENIDYLGKLITVRGVSGPEITTLVGSVGPVVRSTFVDGGVVGLEGFAIFGGTGELVDDETYGGAVYFDQHGVQIHITDCHFANNTADVGGAVYIEVNWGTATFTRCTFNENIATSGRGGAIWSEIDVVLNDCEFTNNSAADNGGAIWAHERLTAIDTTFVGNSSLFAHGGAMATGESACFVQRCTFNENLAMISGGAILSKVDSGHLKVVQSTFDGNLAGLGGAIRIDADDPLLIAKQCVFTNNSATETRGGAVAGTGGETIVGYRISDCTFTGNTAATDGGAVSAHAVDVHINIWDCEFEQNSATLSGGAVFARGASFFQESTFVIGCAFSGNESARGGGIHIQHNGFDGDGLLSEISNSTFFQNVASEQGGGVYTSGSSSEAIIRVANCSMAHNAAPEGGAIFHDGTSGLKLEVANSIVWDNDGGPNDVDHDGGNITVSYSDIDNTFPGEGNIKIPPEFVHGGQGDFRLHPYSPCIDSGNSDLVVHDHLDLDDDGDYDEPMPADFDGLPRFVDDPAIEDCRFGPNCGDAPIVDMGAFERQVATGDLDGDGVVGPADLAIILGNWGPCADPSDCPADLDGDGVVGPIDLAVVLGNWG